MQSGADPEARSREALAFAASLGPASERLLAAADTQALLRSDLRAGLPVEDAVLRLVHGSTGVDRDLAGEFAAYFLERLLGIAARQRSGLVAAHAEPSDLVQSVLGDLASDLSALRFDDRASFLTLLAGRLRWKARDWNRRLTADKRREDLREPAEGDEVPGTARDPASVAAAREEWECLALRISELPHRDQLLLRLHLTGEGPERMARELGLSKEAARKALQRAVRRARGQRQP